MSQLPLMPSQPDDSRDAPEETPTGSRWGKAHHVLLLFLAAAVVVWLLSGIYQVNTSEQALIERLGQFVGNAQGKPEIVEHGLHYALPWPIDKVHKVSIVQTRTLHLTTFNAPPAAYEELKKDFRRNGVRDELLSAIFDPYLITADRNVVHVDIAVQYNIRNSEAWLMAVSHNFDNPDDLGNRDELLEQITSHVLITILSRRQVDKVLFEGSEELPKLLTDALSDAMTIPDPSDPTKTSDLGVEINKVDVQPPRPPAYIRPAFEGVLSARAERDILQAKAKSDANSMTESARAERENMVRDATAYADQVVKAAEGEANRFKDVLKEYQNAPDITRYRIYSDAVNEVAKYAERVYWVKPGQQVVITIDPPKFDAGQIPK